MEITLVTGTRENLRVNVVVVGAFADGALSPPAQAIDKASQGKLSSVIQRGDLDEKVGAALLLHDPPGTASSAPSARRTDPRTTVYSRAGGRIRRQPVTVGGTRNLQPQSIRFALIEEQARVVRC